MKEDPADGAPALAARDQHPAGVFNILSALTHLSHLIRAEQPYHLRDLLAYNVRCLAEGLGDLRSDANLRTRRLPTTIRTR